MRRAVELATMTVVIIISVLCVFAGHSAIKNYVNQKNEKIKYWSEAASKYQSETLKLYFDKEKSKVIKPKSKPVALVDVIQRVKPGVVHIECPQWQCSGFVVGPNLIATVRHGVEGVEDFIITTDDGHKLHATRAVSSKEHDTAFIYVDDLTCVRQKFEKGSCEDESHKVKLHVLKLGSIAECQLGQKVFTVGSPYGKINFNSVTLGIISGLDRDWDMTDPWTGEKYGWEVAFTTSSPGHPGNSGCPVFTMDGKVRGILVGGFSPVLISVMPSDLFLSDIDKIELMFKLDEYQKEVQADVVAEAWGD